MRTEYVYLLIAIIAEVMATSSLKASQGFTRLIPSLVVMVGYGAAFYFLPLSLKGIGGGGRLRPLVRDRDRLAVGGRSSCIWREDRSAGYDWVCPDRRRSCHP